MTPDVPRSVLLALLALPLAGLAVAGVVHQRAVAEEEADPEAPPSGAPDLAWRAFAPPDGGYAIDMPGEPRRTDRPLALVGTTLHYDGVGLDWGVFGASFTDYPEELLSAKGPAGILADCVRGFSGAPGHALVSDHALEVSGLPAREFVVTGEATPGQPAVFHTRALLRGRRLLVLQVIGDPERVEAADVERFFGSFRLR